MGVLWVGWVMGDVPSVFADLNGDLVGLLSDGRAALARLDGSLVAGPFAIGADMPYRVAVSESSGLLFAAQFQGAIAAFDWRSGAHWHVCGFHELSEICCTTRTVLLLQMNGRCVELDQETGEVIGELRGVTSLFSDTRHDRLILFRRGIEYRRRLTEPPVHDIESHAAELIAGCFGPSFFIAASAGSIVRCFDLTSGREMWRHDPGQGRQFVELVHCPDTDVIFAECSDAEVGGPGIGVLLDRHDGTVLREQPLPGADAAILQGGRMMAFSTGVLSLPDLNWMPVPFSLGT